MTHPLSPAAPDGMPGEPSVSGDWHRHVIDAAATVGVIVTDRQGRITDWSGGASRLLGWSKAEMVGRDFDTWCGMQGAPEADTVAGSASKAGPPTEHWLPRRDGSRLCVQVETLRLPGEDDRPAGMAWIILDRTREDGATQVLEQPEARLQQAEQMEALGQLTSGLVHDFNNLLTGIMGSLELLQMQLAKGRTDGLDPYITAALGAAGRAAALTHRLLAVSRRQVLDPTCHSGGDSQEMAIAESAGTRVPPRGG
jgi:PAS domain S-box-containing protein